ncbi:MAG: sugar kinase [Planctomycetes bacterium]|nr:sugar kinase [Planctomycetota bacterium]
MSLLVAGSVAFDSIKTPAGQLHDTLGGAAVYFSLAASFHGPVRLVGVVGGDFPEENRRLLARRGIDLAGLETVAGGKTFRWAGEYFDNMNRRETLSVELNVLKDFQPKLPATFRDTEFVFLANSAPRTQMSVLEQVRSPRFVMADTMDLWIQTQRQDLLDLLERIDGLVINDSEALLLTGAGNLVEAGKEILDLGPGRAIIKKGENGAMLFTREQVVPLPAFPVHDVKDPTGAGDSFAGGLMGYLARSKRLDGAGFKAALAHGAVVASLCVEEFGVRRLLEAEAGEVEHRFQRFCELLRIE